MWDAGQQPYRICLVSDVQDYRQLPIPPFPLPRPVMIIRPISAIPRASPTLCGLSVICIRLALPVYLPERPFRTAVPLYTEPTASTTEPRKATLEEIYTQIFKDPNKTGELLKGMSVRTTNQVQAGCKRCQRIAGTPIWLTGQWNEAAGLHQRRLKDIL